MTEGHTFDPTILREYDIRGVVGETFSAKDFEAIGRAFGTIAFRKGAKSVAVGYDGRLSSLELESALVQGLSSVGLAVKRIGLGPSPMLYFATHFLETDAGCMVTGSHNPPDYNGIKMSLMGKSFFGADIQELGRLSAAGDFEIGRGKVTDHDILDDYVARVLRDYGGGRALKVAWDAGNGAAGEALVKTVAGLPGEHILLNETIDGTFPSHHPDPTVEKNLDQLKAAVIENGCDLGVGFDGDGDRIGVVDGHGRVLWGDQILLILASEVLQHQPGAAIIADVKASQVLFDEVARLGGRPVMWKTGHSLIKTKMAEEGAPLAGEMSAHIFFADKFYGHDDALYAAIRLLSIVAGGEKSLADMRDAMPQTVSTPEIRFDCAEDRKFTVIDEVKERLAGESALTVHDMDGVRVETADGWWLLRASNTQAVLVARCEASDEAGLDRLKAQLVAQLDKSGIKAPDLG